MYQKKVNKLHTILELFLTRKEVSQQDIKKLSKIPYTQIVRALAILKKNNLITCRIERSKDKQGAASNIWSLTLNGLLYSLHSAGDKLGDSEFDVIADNYADMLPLLFGKWQFFADHSIKSEVIKSIKNYLQNFYVPILLFIPTPKPLVKDDLDSYLEKLFEKENKRIEEAKKRVQLDMDNFDQLYMSFVSCVLLLNKGLNVFLPVLKLDNDLSALADGILEIKKNQLESEFKQAQEWLNYWHSLKEGELSK
jgi:hypothetical protein